MQRDVPPHRGAIAGNTVLRHTIDSILDLYAAEQRLIMGLFGGRRRDHPEHLAVLKAIRARPSERTAVMMRRHLGDVRAVLEQRLATESRGGIAETGENERARPARNRAKVVSRQ